MVKIVTLARLRASTAVALVVACAFVGTMAHASGRVAARPSISALLRDSLRADYDRNGVGDAMYFSDGRWHSGDDGYWPTNTSLATASAVLFARTHEAWLSRAAVSTINTAIVKYRRSDGSFSGTDSPDIATMLFSSQLARTYLALGGKLSDATRARWRNTLVGGADYLIRHGNLSWYTNGNIVLGNAEVMALTFKVTGDSRYSRAYERAFRFALAPSGVRWNGFGLHVTRKPSRQDGSDGAGYLTERPDGGSPGFDPEYTELQLDIASRLYLLTRDKQTLRLTNELLNSVLPHVDRKTWLLDTSGGTRHTQVGRHVPFTTPALAVLAWQGGRTRLANNVASQLAVVDRQYRGALTFSSRNYYRGLGDQIATMLEATYKRREVATR